MESQIQQQEIQSQVRQLSQTLPLNLSRTPELQGETLRLPPEKPAGFEPKDIKVEKLDTFTGTHSKLQAFISQLEITFMLSPTRFVEDRTKVLYTISLFRDGAFNWIQPMLRESQEG
jgi:hypothetical protein